MTDIQNILNERYVNKGSYKVPDNYFCQLQNSITKRIKLEESKKIDTPVTTSVAKKKFFLLSPRFRYVAAACFIGFAVLTAVSLVRINSNSDHMMAEQQDIQSEQYYNDCMEYAMVDNDDIYTYLAEQ